MIASKIELHSETVGAGNYMISDLITIRLRHGKARNNAPTNFLTIVYLFRFLIHCSKGFYSTNSHNHLSISI